MLTQNSMYPLNHKLIQICIINNKIKLIIRTKTFNKHSTIITIPVQHHGIKLINKLFKKYPILKVNSKI